jgi:hypothetical protein
VADAISKIQGFKSYCDSHEPYDVIISAIRDHGDRERANFLLAVFDMVGRWKKFLDN